MALILGSLPFARVSRMSLLRSQDLNKRLQTQALCVSSLEESTVCISAVTADMISNTVVSAFMRERKKYYHQ